MTELNEESFRFSPRDEVAHIENLTQKMFVKEIKRRKALQYTGEPAEDGEGFKKIPREKIDGILVYWFEKKQDGEKEMKEEKFHTSLLVPWSIAKNGQESVDKWIKQKTIFKNSK